MNVTTSEPYVAPEPPPLVAEDIGLFGRFWRGRIWYGTEWYITLFGGLVLVAVLIMTLFAPILAPHDPNAFVGGPFTPPRYGLQAALAIKGTDTIATEQGLEGKEIGVYRLSNGASWTKEVGIERTRYQDIEEMLAALESGEVDLALVEERNVEELLIENPQFEVILTGLGRSYPLGTDNLGRDMLSRVIWGARTILGVAVISAIFSSVIGIPLGLTSAFIGGKLDRTLSLAMDSIYSFPGLLLAVALAAMLGPSLLNVAVAISVVYIPTFFRVTRGQVLSIKEHTYVEAARSLGAKNRSILFRYIFPNVIPSVVVVFSLNVADAIITAAALSFIGLGLPPDVPDWGYDLNKGHSFLVAGHWWLITIPGVMIALVAAGFSMLGEGLSEILNPRLVKG